ncbi:MAG: efflux RND transporter periplasmic adaptor subunit [Candidatus Omnitrophota bacterium]|nr:efflux RND transporter periplasmic adaptor subunit [Candidatus Omnitrophota bacterium]
MKLSRRKMAVGILFLTAVFGGLAVTRLARQPGHAGHAEEAALYYCPMHPDYTAARSGECPICHMQLVKREPEQTAAQPAAVAAKGYAAILLSPQKRQLIGVKTSPARKQPLAKKIRTVGLVMVDETRVVHVHPKVEGWIKEIYARYEGDSVKKGQPLFSFYSPDFISVQQEHLTALRLLKELPADAGAQVKESAEKNLEAVRQRLLWWDVTEAQVQELERQGKPSEMLVLVSPMDGIILKKHVWAGEFMERGADFYHIADLSSLWVDARLYELDLPFVRVGQEAVITFEKGTEQALRGKVVFVSPTLDMETRTAVARLEFPNAGGKLKPGMFATAEISVDLGERLVVPAESVLDSGTRQLLFVDKGEGLLEPREVTVGVKGNGLWEIVQGVSEGEPVVVNGNFLVDSESRLKAALEGAAGQGHQHGQ